MTPQNNLYTPWSLHFDRDGNEDVGIICNANGEDLITSRHFWLPEGDDVVPSTLAGLWLMIAAPKLAAALAGLLDSIGALPINTLDRPAYSAITTARTALAQAITGDSSSELLKTIVVYVKGGVVTYVENVPPGYKYEVMDYDNLDESDNTGHV